MIEDRIIDQVGQERVVTLLCKLCLSGEVTETAFKALVTAIAAESLRCEILRHLDAPAARERRLR